VEYRLGDYDVLAHEFRIEGGLIVHEIVFSNQRAITVIAETVMVRTELHTNSISAGK